MRFEVDDEDAFRATSQELIARFEARLREQDQSLTLASDADLMLNWKWGYDDGDLSWWRTGHLDELLLEWYPRKVSGPPELVQLTLPSVAAFLGFLASRWLPAGSARMSTRRLAFHRVNITTPSWMPGEHGRCGTTS